MNPIIKAEMDKKVSEIQEAATRKMNMVIASAERLDSMLLKLVNVEGLEDLGSHVYLSDWSDSVFLHVKGETKAEFSKVVRAITEALGELPETDVHKYQFTSGTSYMAKWKDNGLHVSLQNPKDCMMIEVEAEEEVRTTRTVSKLVPHPACKAALKELED